MTDVYRLSGMAHTVMTKLIQNDNVKIGSSSTVIIPWFCPTIASLHRNLKNDIQDFSKWLKNCHANI